MKKIIKKYSTSTIISFSPEEVKIYDIKEGDLFDIELTKIRSSQDEK